MKSWQLNLAFRKRIYSWGLPLLVGCLSAIAGSAMVDEVPWLGALELQLQQGTSVRTGSGLLESDVNRIVHVVINDQTRVALAGGEDDPIPRKDYARVIRRLHAAKCKGLLVVVFMGSAGEEDALLASALKESQSMPTYLAAVEDGQQEIPDPSESDGVRYDYRTFPYLSDTTGKRPFKRVYPLTFTEGHIGQVVMKYDRKENEWLPGSGLILALMVADIPLEELQWQAGKQQVNMRGHQWNADANGVVRVVYNDPLETFREVDLVDALQMPDEKFQQVFAGRVVVLGEGPESPNILDTDAGYLTVPEWTSIMALSYLQSGRRQLAMPVTVAYFAGFGILASIMGLRNRSLVAWTGLLGLIVIGLAAPRMPLIADNWIIETVGSIITASLAFAVSFAVVTLFGEPSRRPGEQMVGTAVFIDLESSTQLLGAIGAEAYRTFFAKWIAQVEAQAKKLGGRIERTTGDGAFLVFFARHEADTVFQAIAFALACTKLTQQVGADVGLTPKCRIGLEMGSMSGDYVTEGGRRMWSSTGSCVNLARRVVDVQLSEPVPIRLGPDCAKLAQLRHTLASVGMHELKGFDGSKEVFGIQLSNEA